MYFLHEKKRFWSAAKLLLSDKIKTSAKVTLVEEEKPITEDTENAQILCEIFSNTVKTSKVKDYVLQMHWLIVFLILP